MNIDKTVISTEANKPVYVLNCEKCGRFTRSDTPYQLTEYGGWENPYEEYYFFCSQKCKDDTRLYE